MYDSLETYYDGREIPSGEVVSCDLCIIGAGAAGITIAREFAKTNQRVLILESGDLSFDEDTNELDRLIVTGHAYPELSCRLRYFGGTTNHWGGHCVPIRPSVFEKREWIPYSGWPFGIEELHPYYARAHQIIELGPYDYDPQPVAKRLGYKLFPFDPAQLETSLSRYHRQRFGIRYRQDLENARNVSVMLYANITSINLDDYKRVVTDVSVNTLTGNSFSVQAKLFVLATGGIENARLLLLSDRDMPAGLGNQNDLVGRFFQEHIWYKSGYILPVDQDEAKVALYGNEIPYERQYAVRCHLVLPERRVRELQIPEYRVELQIRRTRSLFPSVQSAHKLKKSIESLDLDEISATDILNVARDPGPPLAEAIGVVEKPLVYEFANYVEQVPNPDSRVTLSSQVDVLGQRRAILNWQLSSLDKEGIKRAQQVIAQEVGRSGIGRMNVHFPEEETILEGAKGGCHHMGTTRMHVDPKQGVVDSDCRIHGLENIYVAGSSVFPVAGFPNPTLTITALAVRLVDHLKLQFAKL